MYLIDKTLVHVQKKKINKQQKNILQSIRVFLFLFSKN